MKSIYQGLTLFWAALLILMTACTSQPQRPRVEEVAFDSGAFHLVGDLILPAGSGPFPVIIEVLGSGPGERMRGDVFGILPLGYAMFSWDSPGFGESTGFINESRVIAQRAQILLEAIDVMKSNPNIDPKRIGLFGQSQGGYVIPRALAHTNDVAFVICFACPCMSGRDQTAYQITLMAFCNDTSGEKTEPIASLLSTLKAAAEYDTYDEYLYYRQVLDAVAVLTLANIHDRPAISQKIWEENPLEPQTYWNPVKGIEQTDIPILAILGDLDRNVDPFQAAYTWRQTLARAGNPRSRVEIFPGVDHVGLNSKTGCPDEWGSIYDRYAKLKGYASMHALQEAIGKDPYKPGWFDDLPFAPGLLELIQEWLKDM